MGTAERRLEILKYLCKARKTTMGQLAEMFGVSIRTIQRDIYEIEVTFHVPLDVKCGKYEGGIYVIGDYSFDRAYMCDDELNVLRKMQSLVKDHMSDSENKILSQIIRKYTKSAQLILMGTIDVRISIYTVLAAAKNSIKMKGKEKMNEKRIGSEELILEPETKEAVEGLTTDIAKESEEISVELEAGPKKIFRVNEIRAYRETNKKVFSMSDGSEQAVFYPGAVHVSNEESGEYEETDSTLVVEEDGKHYHNRKGHFKARFSCDEESDELFSVEKGECRVIVSKKKDDKKRGNGVISKLHKKQRGRFGAVESLVFQDVETATDMEYTITADGVKENILVKAKREKYRYPFVLRCENVTAHLDEETKRIAFNSKETGEEVFFFSEENEDEE